jgi:hypothetical protein
MRILLCSKLFPWNAMDIKERTVRIIQKTLLFNNICSQTFEPKNLITAIFFSFMFVIYTAFRRFLCFFLFFFSSFPLQSTRVNTSLLHQCFSLLFFNYNQSYQHDDSKKKKTEKETEVTNVISFIKVVHTFVIDKELV